jgi:serine/threonine protein kinase
MTPSAVAPPSSSLLDAGFADLVEDLTARLYAGERVDLEACLRDHPEHADRLGRVLPALRLLADVSRSRPTGLLASAAEGEAGSLTGTLGDFRILREIGRGGMGVVYEAEQISLRRRVALKVLPFASALDPRRLQRFQNEAQAAAALHHTNIVPVHGIGCERAVHFYAMQYIEGQSLAAILRELRHHAGRAGDEDEEPVVAAPVAASAETALRAGLSTEQSIQSAGYFRAVAELGIQAAEALEHAHEMGVIHRDIKPANLLIDGRGKLWITDFGLAQIQSDTRLTLTGDLVGTLRYMSPEQALAKRAIVDHRTDIYSLGATLYELLTLEPAFTGKDREELLRRLAFEEPRPPRRVNKAIPTELETIVLKALEKNPVDRYAAAKEMAVDLRHWLDHKPIQARKPTLMQRVRKAAQRHPGVLVTAAIATVAGLVLGVAGLVVSNRMLRQEQRLTKSALDQAEQEKAVAQAVRDFLRFRLLSQADPRAQADALLKRGGKSAGAKPNLTVRELLGRAAQELAPDQFEGQFRGQPLVQAEILRTVGDTYGGIGDYGPAISHLKRARDLQTQELGFDHPDTLATLHSLARAYLDAGQTPEAVHLLEQVRDERSATLGPGHADTLASVNDLSRCYFKLGRHEEAFRLREDIVKLREASLGPDDPETLASMMNLANSYAAFKRYDKALELHQATLTRRQARLGPNHYETLKSMNNVANYYTALGRHSNALKLHKETLALRKETLGENDPETLLSMNNVAVALYALGRHAEAIQLHGETLARRTAKLGRDHPHTLYTMNALAWILATAPQRMLRNPGRALELSSKAVELAPDEGDYQNTLGVACYRMGDWKGSLNALSKSMALRKGGDCTDWFFRAMARWRLGDKHQARQWFDKAVGWMEKKKSSDEELHRFRAEAAELLETVKK